MPYKLDVKYVKGFPGNAMRNAHTTTEDLLKWFDTAGEKFRDQLETYVYVDATKKQGGYVTAYNPIFTEEVVDVLLKHKGKKKKYDFVRKALEQMKVDLKGSEEGGENVLDGQEKIDEDIKNFMNMLY